MEKRKLTADDPLEERVARWQYVHDERLKDPPTPYRLLAEAMGVSRERVRQLAAMVEPPGLPRWAGHSARNVNGADEGRRECSEAPDQVGG